MMFLYFYKNIFDLKNHTLRTFGLGKRTFSILKNEEDEKL